MRKFAVVLALASTALASPALARDNGVAVHFVGRVSDDELPAYFQAADVACSPALRGESFGIVLLEAMACGTPLVASRIDGYEALVGTSGCGHLVTPGDAGALAEEGERLVDRRLVALGLFAAALERRRRLTRGELRPAGIVVARAGEGDRGGRHAGREHQRAAGDPALGAAAPEPFATAFEPARRAFGCVLWLTHGARDASAAGRLPPGRA